MMTDSKCECHVVQMADDIGLIYRCINCGTEFSHGLPFYVSDPLDPPFLNLKRGPIK